MVFYRLYKFHRRSGASVWHSLRRARETMSRTTPNMKLKGMK